MRHISSHLTSHTEPFAMHACCATPVRGNAGRVHSHRRTSSATDALSVTALDGLDEWVQRVSLDFRPALLSPWHSSAATFDRLLHSVLTNSFAAPPSLTFSLSLSRGFQPRLRHSRDSFPQNAPPLTLRIPPPFSHAPRLFRTGLFSSTSFSLKQCTSAFKQKLLPIVEAYTLDLCVCLIPAD